MLTYMTNDRDEVEEEELFKVFRGRLLAARGAMSQSDLSALFAERGWELKQAALSHYETGKRRPNFFKLIQFATVHETSTDYLLGRTDETRSIAELEKALAEASGGGRIHEILQDLPTPKRQQVLQFAEYLLSQEKKTQEPSLPVISPLPFTERQRNAAIMKEFLDSVERQYGVKARRDLERSIRDQFPDDAPPK